MLHQFSNQANWELVTFGEYVTEQQQQQNTFITWYNLDKIKKKKLFVLVKAWSWNNPKIF